MPLETIKWVVSLFVFTSFSIYLIIAIRKTNYADVSHPFREVVFLYSSLIIIDYLFKNMYQGIQVFDFWISLIVGCIFSVIFAYIGIIIILSKKAGIKDLRLFNGVNHIVGIAAIIICILYEMYRLYYNFGLIAFDLRGVSLLGFGQVIFNVVLEEIIVLCYLPIFVHSLLYKKISLSKNVNSFLCLVLCAVVFALFHFYFTLFNFLNFFGFYILLYFIKKFSKSIMYSMLFHVVTNFFIVFFIKQ